MGACALTHMRPGYENPNTANRGQTEIAARLRLVHDEATPLRPASVAP